MFKKTTMILLTVLASVLTIAASAGAGFACWSGFYQPASPKDLK